MSKGDIIQQQSRGMWKVVTLMDAVEGGTGADIGSQGEDVSLYTYMTLDVETTDTCLVRYQTSYDNTNWSDPMVIPNGTDDVTDITETYDVVAEKRNIKITRQCRYIRTVVHCTAASTVTATLFAQM